MKKNFKNGLKKGKRGITLVTLAITMVVMLIGAGVAINLAVNTDGIVDKAQQSASDYTSAAENEQQQIASLEEHMNNEPETFKLVIYSISEINSIFYEGLAEVGMTWEEWVNSEYASGTGYEIKNRTSV